MPTNNDLVFTPLEGWIIPTLLNGWVNFGGDHENVAYYSDPLGIIEIRGFVRNGTMGSPIFILPINYRSATRKVFSVMMNNGSDVSGRIDIHTDGRVVAVSGGNVFVSLAGIRFRKA